MQTAREHDIQTHFFVPETMNLNRLLYELKILKMYLHIYYTSKCTSVVNFHEDSISFSEIR